MKILHTQILFLLLALGGCKPETTISEQEKIYEKLPAISEIPADALEKGTKMSEYFAASDLYFEAGTIKSNNETDGKSQASLSIASQAYSATKDYISLTDGAKVLVFQEPEANVVVIENKLPSPTSRGADATTIYLDKNTGKVKMTLAGYPK